MSRLLDSTGKQILGWFGDQRNDPGGDSKCCATPCVSTTLDVTIAGLNSSAVCSNFHYGGADFRNLTLAVDGTYSLSPSLLRQDICACVYSGGGSGGAFGSVERKIFLAWETVNFTGLGISVFVRYSKIINVTLRVAGTYLVAGYSDSTGVSLDATNSFADGCSGLVFGEHTVGDTAGTFYIHRNNP